MSTVEYTQTIRPQMAGTLMTPEEFDTAPDWTGEYAYELINGMLIMSPLPSGQERRPNDFLAFLFWSYANQHPVGEKFVYSLSEPMVHISQGRRRADRQVWVNLGRIPNVHRDVPSIAIEFVSAGRQNQLRDYQVKRDEYAALGTGEYWIIDRFRRQMTIVGNLFGEQNERIIHECDLVTTPLLPGFEFPLAELLRESDLLDQAE